MANTQFRTKKGIEIVDGSVSIFYGKGAPSATVPQATAKLSNGDLYHNSDDQKLYRFNGTTWVLAGTVNRLGDGNFANNNYITDVDDNGTNTFTKAISDLDARAKVNADQIATLVSGANPQGFAMAITGDTTNFGTAVAGPVAAAVQPSDANQTITPANGDILFCVDGTRWDFDGTNYVKNTTNLVSVKDLWAIKYDLPDVAGQELTALYIYTATGFVKFGEVSNDIATAIGLGGSYAASAGIVSSSDTVQTALQKLDGNIGTRIISSPKVVTSGESASDQIADLDAAIGARTYTNDFEVADNESIAASIDKLDTAIGDRSAYASVPRIISNNDSLAVAIGKLDQAAGFAVDETSDTGALTASQERLNVNNAIGIKWYITVIETPVTGRGAVYCSEIIAIYQGAGSDDTYIDSTEYGIVQLGAFDSGPTITLGYSGTSVNIAVSASKAGSTVHVSIKGMILGEFTNNVA